MAWIDTDDGLRFVNITTPSVAEAEWAAKLARGIDAGINVRLGEVALGPEPVQEIKAAALRAFGYGWKYREAPFGEAQWLDEQGGAVRLASDWLDPIKAIIDRYRDVTQMIG